MTQDDAREVRLREAILAEWSRAEHDPGCPGDEKYCSLHCPVPAYQGLGIDGLAEAAVTAVERIIAAREADLREQRDVALVALDAAEAREADAVQRIADLTEALAASERDADHLQEMWDAENAAKIALRAQVADAVQRGKVEGLREAASGLPGFAADIRTHGDAARWLRERADRIAGQTGEAR